MPTRHPSAARIAALAVALVATAGVVGAAGAASDPIAKLLPDDTQGMVVVRSLSRLFEAFEVDSLRAQYPDSFAYWSDRARATIGFDPLDLRALREHGVDPDRPLAAALVGESHPSLVVLLPGSEKAAAWIRSSFEAQGAPLARSEEHGGVTIAADDSNRVALWTKKHTVVLVARRSKNETRTPLETAAWLLDRSRHHALADAQRYRDVAGRVARDGDVFVYLGAGVSRQFAGARSHGGADRPSPQAVDRWMARWHLDGGASALALRFAPDRLIVDGFNRIDERSPFAKVYAVDADVTSFFRRLASRPEILLLGRLNLSVVWPALREWIAMSRPDSLPPLDEALATAGKELGGVDVERDLIDQVRGNVGVLFNRIALMGGDVVGFVQLADPEAFRSTLKRLVDAHNAMSAAPSFVPRPQAVPDTLGGVAAYRLSFPPFGEICAGVVGDHLVVTFSRARFEKIAAGAGGFLAGLDNHDVRDAVAGDARGVFYADFRRVERDLQSFSRMFGGTRSQMMNTFSGLSELWGIARTEHGGTHASVTLTATRPGMWRRLAAFAIEANGGPPSKTH